MFPLSQQVTSLDLSMRLKALNVEQNSLFTYVDEDVTSWRLRYTENITESTYEHFNHNSYFVSAFLASELGEMLPDEIISSRSKNVWTSEKLSARCFFEDGGNYPKNSPYGEASTEAEARGLMLEYLIEQKLI